MKKVILVTGASSGIGRDAAELLAADGHTVYGAARRVEKIAEIPGVHPLPLDVTDELSCVNCIDTILKEEGRIDVLVNNAGFGYFGPIETVPLDDARNQLEVNLFGLARLTKEVIPHMRENGGRIINLSSVAGRVTLYFGGWYHVSKYAVEAFSDSLRTELKPLGIDVVMIEPGGIRTNWGIIAADHLKASSEGTPYETPAFNEAEVLKYAYSSKWLANPRVVARAIRKAVDSKRPRARYIVGTGARALLFFHWLLPSKWWDSASRLGGKIHFDNNSIKPQ